MLYEAGTGVKPTLAKQNLRSTCKIGQLSRYVEHLIITHHETSEEIYLFLDHIAQQYNIIEHRD